MTDAGDSPYVYRSGAFRAASIAAAVFLCCIGLAVAVFAGSVEDIPNTRFFIVDAVVTALAAGWMALGARVRIEMGDGAVRVITKTRRGQFPASQIDRFEFRTGKLGGIPIGSAYVHLVQVEGAPKSPGVRDGVLNTWSPAPGPVDRAAVLRDLQARLAAERALESAASAESDSASEPSE